MHCNNCNTKCYTNDRFCATCGCTLSLPQNPVKSTLNKQQKLAMAFGIISLSYPFASFLIWAISLFLTLSSNRSISLAANWVAGNIFAFSIVSCGLGIIAVFLGIKNKKTAPIILGTIGSLFSITVCWMSMLG